jgi:hypothetical protein
MRRRLHTSMVVHHAHTAVDTSPGPHQCPQPSKPELYTLLHRCAKCGNADANQFAFANRCTTCEGDGQVSCFVCAGAVRFASPGFRFRSAGGEEQSIATPQAARG